MTRENVALDQALLFLVFAAAPDYSAKPQLSKMVTCRDPFLVQHMSICPTVGEAQAPWLVSIRGYL